MLSLCFPNKINDEDFINKMNELKYVCEHLFSCTQLASSQDHKDFRLLIEINHKSTDSQLESLDLTTLTPCVIKLLLKYSNTPIHLESNLSNRNREKKQKLIKNFFERILRIFVKSQPNEIMKCVIDVLETKNFWRARRFSVSIISQLINFDISVAAICHEICNKIEFPNKDIDTKLIVRVLYELLGVYPWPNTEDTKIFLERLLNLYYKTLHDNLKNEDNVFFAKLRGSLELCIRHIVKNISRDHLILTIQRMTAWSVHANINENVIANYGSALEYVASMNHELSISSILTSEIVELLMGMIASTEQFVSLLGNRVLQYMIDRGENRTIFNTPKIFFEGMKLNLVLQGYKKDDCKFWKLHRELIHDSLTKSIINHHYDRLNLETTYCTLCLLTVEVPCGFTAANICCLMMNVQNITMEQTESIGKEASYHIHAIIISVLTFVCWVHKAIDFYAYIYKIVLERAQWAPHLNPPLRSKYNFAVHHVLWNKSELFFIDWEVRYGLWRRFRLNEDENTGDELTAYKKVELHVEKKVHIKK